MPGGVAAFVDPSTTTPYGIHFFAFEVVGESGIGQPETVHAEVVAVLEDDDGQSEVAPPDVLHDLTPADSAVGEPPTPEVIQAVVNWVRVNQQVAATTEERQRRQGQAALRVMYLSEALDSQQLALEGRRAEYDERVFRGEEYRLQRDETARRRQELERRRGAKLKGFAKLGVVRPGPVTYLGTAAVCPPDAPEDLGVRAMRQDPTTGEQEVRRIEVKGRSAPTGDVDPYRTEWFAAQRFRGGYWLYVVYGAGTGNERLVVIRDPYGRLRGVEEIAQVTGYRVPAASIEAYAASDS